MTASESQQVRATTRTQDGTTYTGTYVLRAGAAHLTELTVTVEERDTLTAERLRAAPLAELHGQVAGTASAGWLSTWREDAARLPSRFRSEEHYQQLVALWLRLKDEGDRQPVQTIADATGQSRNSVAARLQTARKRGLMTSEEG